MRYYISKLLNKGFIVRKILIFWLFCTFLNAQIINSIVAIVENEPITANQIKIVSSKFNLNYDDALEILIKDRLKEAQIKVLNISANNFEIDERISNLAQSNSMSVENFQNALLAQGVNFEQFRQEISDAIKQEKLYSGIFSEFQKNISEDDAKKYYEQNLEQFHFFENIDVVLYKAKNPNLLQQVKTGSIRNTEKFTIKNLHLNLSQLNKNQMYLFKNAQNGTFTPIVRSDNGYEMYYVSAKNGEKTIEFDAIKGEILNQMMRMEQSNAINEYFDKLRSKANIVILRRAEL